jgi:diguanylate cyclase (GGDEF)-like protein
VDRRRLDLQTLVLQSGIASFFLAGVVSGLFGAEEPWRTPAVIWIAGYHMAHAGYVIRFRARGRPLRQVEFLTPAADISCITLGWLSLGDPYSPLWAVYLYCLVGYSRRFEGWSFLGLAALVVVNVAGAGSYLTWERSGALVDSNLIIMLGMTAFMAMLAAAIGDAWRDAETRARTLANTDPLTGIANRRTFLEELESLAVEPGTHFSVLMLDLDNFKALNDQHGHLHGDNVLALAAATLEANLRPNDNVARYGGEEFVVMLPGAGREEAAGIGERLRIAVEQETPTSVSIGCATRRWGESAQSVLRRADDLLLTAKRSGKNVLVAQPPTLAA